jgi:hypothetical protein
MIEVILKTCRVRNPKPEIFVTNEGSVLQKPDKTDDDGQYIRTFLNDLYMSNQGQSR